MMALQKERGVNPLAGCLPILPQIPIFLAALPRAAPAGARGAEGLYGWSDELTDQAAQAKLFGAPISASFNMTGAKEAAILAIPGVTYTDIRIVAFVLIVIMCVTTFFTQKQIMKRSGPVEGQAAMVQKLLLYGMPISLFVSGFFFPIGVLLYWFTNNLWTLGQQFFILRKMPPPGSDADKAKAGAEKPVVDPRTLAPKPGAKPVRPKPGRPTADGDRLRRRRRRRRTTPPAGNSADGKPPTGSRPGRGRYRAEAGPVAAEPGQAQAPLTAPAAPTCSTAGPTGASTTGDDPAARPDLGGTP